MFRSHHRAALTRKLGSQPIPGYRVKASVTPTSSPVGFWAFSGVLFSAVTEDSLIDLAGLVVFPAISSGMDATGWWFAFANAAAFALG
jgi:hypothetical protein